MLTMYTGGVWTCTACFPSLASNQLLTTVFTSPQQRVQDGYALALLRNKDVIEVEYSANYIGSDGLVLPIREAGGTRWVANGGVGTPFDWKIRLAATLSMASALSVTPEPV